ncbi:MAG TPA: hypothetical protein GX530_07570 [Corynebacteriales bacterium]|nr:hypothetical protein [Mycobacteriales bacterium]
MSKLKRKGNPNLKSNVKGDMFMLEPIEHFTAHSHPVSKTELSAEYAMAETLIDQAMKAYSGSERERKLPNAFAAIFDLLVAAEYYSTIRNSGWLLCAGESHRSKLAIYPFTNACPRCALQKEFAYSKSNKPESGQIGTFTTRLLAVLVDCLLSKRGFNEIELRLGKEPIDLILIDKTNKIVLLCEVKAAPLTTPPMCVDYAHRSLVSGHSKIGVLDFDPNTQYYIMIPYRSSGEQWSYDLVPITLSPSNKDRVYESLAEKFCVRQQFEDYIAFWNSAFRAYSEKTRSEGVYWLTNACGAPFPRPDDWPPRDPNNPKRGFNTISDSKTSVGMDRTDDIKKGTYQMLKIGIEDKLLASDYTVYAAIMSNIHAVRHYDDYLRLVRNIVWTPDETNRATKVRDLPDDTKLYNLFDGIITLTETYSRNEWIEERFNFSKY